MAHWINIYIFIYKKSRVTVFVRIESFDSPARRDCKGSGGVGRGNNTTFPDAQHMPVASLQSFNA